MSKEVKKPKLENAKKVVQPQISTEGDKQIWVFDSVDRDGYFSFTPSRADMDCEDLLDKIIHFSMRTWGDIRRDKHDNNKSKHHFLSFDSLSDLARERINKLQLSEFHESIFSMRLNNLCRIIGLRDGSSFVVKWFDPRHEFAPMRDK